MKGILLSFAILVFPASLFAQLALPSPDVAGELTPKLKDALLPAGETGPYLQAESAAIGKELATAKLADMTLAELSPYRDRLSVAAQKDAYVKKMATLSFEQPGAGQVKMGDRAEGIGFMSLHLALLFGESVGAILFLPQDLREIDYVHRPYAEILNAYASHNLNDFLPAIEFSAAGLLADLGVKVWSSIAAGNEARQRVDQGKQTFEPLIGPGFLGFGISY
jgi:hypothetical protein